MKEGKESFREIQRKLAHQSAVSRCIVSYVRSRYISYTHVHITQKNVANMHFCHLTKELISANGERHRLHEENNNLDLRLKELSAEYTNRLQQYIHDIAVRDTVVAFPPGGNPWGTLPPGLFRERSYVTDGAS